MGFVNYHRDHVKNFAELTSPLYELAHTEFYWDDHHDIAFREIKEKLYLTPCLVYPIPNGEFILDTDASDRAIGAVLSQIQNGEEKVISYASHVLLKEQRKY